MERESASLHSGFVFAFDVPFSAQEEYTIDLLHQNLIDEIESFYNNSPSHIIKPFKENGKFRNIFDKIDLLLI